VAFHLRAQRHGKHGRSPGDANFWDVWQSEGSLTILKRGASPAFDDTNIGVSGCKYKEVNRRLVAKNSLTGT